MKTSRALVTLVVAAALPVALPIGSAQADTVTAQRTAAAEQTLSASLPDAVVDDLSGAQQRSVAGAVVPDGTGSEVGVAVLDAGRLRIGALEVADASADAVADLLERQPSVEAASVASPVSVAGSPDPLRGQQWALDRLDAEHARSQAATATSGCPVVAVVDSGVDATHPDLDGVLVAGTDLVGSASSGGRVDPNGHGTHVAGIIGAEVGNGIGVEGLDAAVRVMPVRVMNAQGAGSTATVAEGVVWAADHGAAVINMSLGGTQSDPVLRSAVAYAEGKDVVVVAAMGNEGQEGSPTSYPGAYPGVLAVAATTTSDARASFSSQGAHAALAAPGAGILSTVPTAVTAKGYASWSGTSMATPYVAAAAALVRGAAPSLTATQVDDVLTSTATDLGVAGRDPSFGYGLVDPVAAVRTAEAAVTPAAPAPPATPVAPSAPRALAVRNGDRSAVLTWQAPASAGSASRSGYRVLVHGKGQPDQVLDAGPTATSLPVTGLVNGLGYEVTVQARSGAGLGTAATTVARPRTTPSAPRSVTLAAGSTRDRATGVQARWVAPASNGGSTVQRWTVRLRQSGSTKDVLTTVPAAQTSLALTGLVKGRTYTVVVQAVNDAGAGPGSVRTSGAVAR